MDMGKDSGGGAQLPQQANPYDLANSQWGMNQNTFNAQNQGNRVNQFTPYGSSTWSNGGGRWSQDINLDPAQQALLDQQNATGLQMGRLGMGALGRVQDAYSNPFDMSGAPDPVYNVNGGRFTSGVNASQPWGQVPSTPNLQGQVGTAQNFVNGASQGDIQRSVDLSGAPAMPTMNEDTRRRVEESLYSRINPQLDRSQSSLNTELANQGIMPGSEAYIREQGRMSQERNDARFGAVNAGGNEMAREFGLGMQARQQGVGEQFGLGNFANSAQQQDWAQRFANAGMQNQNQNSIFGQNLAAGNFANQANSAMFGMGLQGAGMQNAMRGQQFGEEMQNANLNNFAQQQRFGQGMQNANLANQGRQNYLQENAFLRNLPAQELSYLRGGSQVTNPQFPNYPTGTMAPTDLSGNVNNYYKNLLQQYGLATGQENADSAATGQMGAAAIGGLASTAQYWWPLIFSDRRLKSNIKRIGTHPLGIGIYEYDIFGEHDRGVMADEVLTVRPEAVSVHPSGYLQVAYGRL